MRVVVTGPAQADLAAIFSFVEIESPAAARRIVDRIGSQLAGLSTLPHRGRPGLVGGARQLVLEYGYVATYRVRADMVEVLRVRHGRQSPLG